jgi:HD-GYP domain-containing protein (c-di-GMP phosphodiesterase class II)
MLTSSSKWCGYVAAPIEALAVPLPEYELYIPANGGDELALYRGRRVPIQPGDMDHLRSRGVERLYLAERDLSVFRQQLAECVLHAGSDASPIQRAAAALFLARATLADAFASPKCERLIQSSRALAESITHHLEDESLRMPELLQLVEHDYYTYTHVCNVSMYCLLLARRMGISDAAELKDITVGGLLHDVGKQRIAPHVLNKRGKLTDEEWDSVCRHPLDGYRELVARPGMGWGLLMMVYQHHERFDGSGYPVGVTEGEIHPWAKICMVADVFDALTCDRPYRRALPVENVCAMLRRQAETWFDRDIVDCLCAEVEENACHV